MSLRSFLYLLGASLTITGCFLPWSCRQVGDHSWHCTTAIVLRFSRQDGMMSRLEIQDTVRGSGFIILFLTFIVIFFAFFAPQFIRRSKIIARISSVALVLASAYYFVQTLSARTPENDTFAHLASLTMAIVCIGAVLMLVAGAINQHALRQHPA
jgi:hypothetical protein